jgi:hypothetical protein
VFNGQRFQREVARDMQALGAAILNAEFAPSVTEVLITLPKAIGDRYGETLKSVIDHIGKFPHVRAYIVPPPPARTPQYEATIDQLTDVFRTSQPANIVRLEHRLKSFYTVGWASAIGGAPTEYHVHDGEWTREGVRTIRDFLSRAMKLRWPFDPSPKSAKNKSRRKTTRDRVTNKCRNTAVPERPAEREPQEVGHVRIIKASNPSQGRPKQSSTSGDWLHRDQPTSASSETERESSSHTSRVHHGPRVFYASRLKVARNGARLKAPPRQIHASECELTSHASRVHHSPRVFYSSRLIAAHGRARLEAPPDQMNATRMDWDATGLHPPLHSTDTFDYAAQMRGG